MQPNATPTPQSKALIPNVREVAGALIALHGISAQATGVLRIKQEDMQKLAQRDVRSPWFVGPLLGGLSACGYYLVPVYADHLPAALSPSFEPLGGTGAQTEMTREAPPATPVEFLVLHLPTLGSVGAEMRSAHGPLVLDSNSLPVLYDSGVALYDDLNEKINQGCKWRERPEALDAYLEDSVADAIASHPRSVRRSDLVEQHSSF